MKEINQKQETKVEIVKQAEQKKETKLLGKIILKKGHSLFSYNKETFAIELAEFKKLDLRYMPNLKTNNLAYFAQQRMQSLGKININPNLIYIPALNKKNVIKILKRDFNITL